MNLRELGYVKILLTTTLADAGIEVLTPLTFSMTRTEEGTNAFLNTTVKHRGFMRRVIVCATEAYKVEREDRATWIRDCVEHQLDSRNFTCDSQLAPVLG